MKYGLEMKFILRTFVIIFVICSVYGIYGCSNPDSAFVPTLRLAPNANTPLAALLELTTKVPTRVLVTINDGDSTWDIDFAGFETEHSHPVLGFRPGKTHTVLVSVFDEDGRELLSDFEIEIITELLPEDFPAFTVTSNPDMMEPGITFFEAGGFLIAVNEVGEVVWFRRNEFNGRLDRDFRRLSNGNILLMLAEFEILEIDMLGNVIRRWHPSQSTIGNEGSIPVDTLAFHHEVFEMESGNFVTISIEFREVSDFPTSTTDPSAPTETAIIAGDTIVEYRPDGTVVNEWSLLDIIDPRRINYSSLLGLWDGFYENVFGVMETTRDWAHANAVIHDPSDDSLIVSLRHQDVVIKISRQTGELIWILGPHENWDPVEFGKYLLTPLVDDEFFFQYHQHAPMITQEGNIVLFDNGNFRASPPDPVLPDVENFSRAIEYSIDETTYEVDKVWEYGQFEEEILYAFFVGDADSLPLTRNVLITFGGIQPARLIEVTRTTPSEVVFDLSITNNFTYRSERLPTLYP